MIALDQKCGFAATFNLFGFAKTTLSCNLEKVKRSNAASQQQIQFRTFMPFLSTQN